MNKLKDFSMLFILLFFTIQIIFNNELVLNTILFSYNIFIHNVFPNLFPFLVISKLLINYGFVSLCSKAFSPIFKKLFNINGNASFVFIMSMLTGFPSNAKYTKELVQNDLLSVDEASKILMFTHFSNPLFIIGTISLFIDKKSAFIILLAHYLGNIIIGLIFRNSFLSNQLKDQYVLNEDKLALCFFNAIKDSLNTLLFIFGTITFFLLITSIFNNIFKFPPFYQTIFSGLLEMTQGLKLASMLDVNNKIKAILMTSFLSFGGISVHMQVLSLINDTKIKYHPFLIARLFHITISSLITFLLF